MEINLIRYDNLFRIIEERHLNKNEVFAKCGISHNHYVMISKNLPVPIDCLIRLSSYLGVPVEDVYTINRNSETSPTMLEFFNRNELWASYASVPICLVRFDFIKADHTRLYPLSITCYRKCDIDELMENVHRFYLQRDDLYSTYEWIVGAHEMYPMDMNTEYKEFYEYISNVRSSIQKCSLSNIPEFEKYSDKELREKFKTKDQFPIQYALCYNVYEPQIV